jgi:hypothetical protein
MLKNSLVNVCLFTALTVFGVTGCGGGGGGTSATLGPTVTATAYEGSVQRVSYSDGSVVSNNPTGNSVTWASDHVTKTTTYTYPNGGTNSVVANVPGTPATTYNENTQTIVTTYGDGTTSTATNTATSNAVTWAADRVTKTTTYTFANGGTNPVVTTVPGTAGTPTYSGNTQTIVTTYGDGTTATANNTATSNAVTWASDHVTKTTTYTYANGGTNSVVATVPGTPAITYSGNTQTIVTTYGDGFSTTANNTATSSAVTWAADHVTKTTTYTFANGGTNPVVTTVPGTAGAPTYSGNTQTIVTTYGDGTTATANNTATSNAVTWASDHVTKTTTYTYANGGTNSVVATVPGTPAITYSGNTQTIVTTYGDGFSTTANNTATSSAVTWAADHVTKTTTYTFANGGTNPVVTTVPGTAGAPTYSGNTQTIVTTYGDGTTATANNTATSNAVTWASDHVTKTTVYTYANGGTNSVVATVPGTVSGAVISNINGTASVSPLVTTYGDGFSITTEDGTSLKPFTQATLSQKNISDPNSFMQSATASYDLRWGIKATPFSMSTSDDVSAQISSTTQLIDFVGIGYGAYPRFTLTQGFSFSGSLDATTSNFQGLWITQDVKAAWAEGWTGRNIKVGVIDDFTANNSSDFKRIALSTGCGYINVLGISTYKCSTSSNAYLRLTHGEQVSMIAGGSKNQLTGLISESGTWTDGIDLGTYSSAQNLSINLSSPFYGVAKDATIYRNDFLTYQSSTNGLFSVLKDWGSGTDASSNLYRSLQVLNLSLGGTSSNPVSNQASYATQLGYANISSVPDTVFVKAAGNSSCIINLSNCDPLNAVFFNSPQYKSKTLIVGALDQAGGTIASYSNKAGTYSDIFVVADGRGIYNTGSASYEQGTSFAAPRVAGYAAILRQKFANLNAEQSASIILDTARYDTLSCNPNCPSNIYGKGEASLSRALAPVGRLR